MKVFDQTIHDMIEAAHPTAIAVVIPLGSPSAVPPGIYEIDDDQRWVQTNRRGAFSRKTIRTLKESGRLPC